MLNLVCFSIYDVCFMVICDFMRDEYIFFYFFNNVLRLTPRPASRITPCEAKGKRLDTRFRLFKPCTHPSIF
ncbi:hypothetical protein Hanom_Chr15g01395361 [Helianthus anomalus]